MKNALPFTIVVLLASTSLIGAQTPLSHSNSETSFELSTQPLVIFPQFAPRASEASASAEYLYWWNRSPFLPLISGLGHQPTGPVVPTAAMPGGRFTYTETITEGPTPLSLSFSAGVLVGNEFNTPSSSGNRLTVGGWLQADHISGRRSR